MVRGGLIAFFMILPILIVFPMSFSSAEFLTFPPKGKTYPETYDIDTARPFYVTRKIYEEMRNEIKDKFGYRFKY
jgi:ABC-type spermidine/putrescine transport system permease subunit II